VTRAALLGWVFAVALVAFSPTLGNGFLQLAFDDAIIVDTPALRGLGWANVKAMFTEFNHAHYAPLTMLSLAVDYRIWGLNPFGYHLTNILLHALAATLACVFLWSLVAERTAVVAALIFAAHPVQLEAVSLAIQRKTVLSATLFFVTLILYVRWARTRRPWFYAGALVAFIAAGLAKPIVITLPFLLLLIDYMFAAGRPRIVEKLPFAAVAAFVAAAAAAAHADVGFARALHGGSLLTHVLMVGRVTAEYVTAALMPVDLSPIYYYPRATPFRTLTIVATLTVIAAGLILFARRRSNPWAFFCAGWFAITLLPESNVFPLAQLRADRFMYLPLLGIALAVAIVVDRLPTVVISARKWRLPTHPVAAILIVVLVWFSRGSAAVWRSDVSAWQRVADQHRWAAVAHLMLGRAQAEAGNDAAAETAFAKAARLNDRVADTHLELARLYARNGRASDAEQCVLHFLELAPGDARGQELLARVRGLGDAADGPTGAVAGDRAARPGG
jgi:hypothetical protein